MIREKLFDIDIIQTDSHSLVTFPEPMRVLSSAVCNGGFASARHILNLKVPKNISDDTSRHLPSPADTLTEYFRTLNIQGPWCGMLTAASMDSFRFALLETEDEYFACFLTAGLSNARRAGDRADISRLQGYPGNRGTINIIAGTSASLSPSALVEAVMIVTEAKACLLQDLGIKSMVSDSSASGTGTDSIALFSGKGTPLDYCGKHVKAGELFAAVTFEALGSSLSWYLKQQPS